MLGRKVPMHENGTPIRTWLHAQDTADAIVFLIENGNTNEIYNISGNYEDANINIFQKILMVSGIDPNSYADYADFSFTRPGQDVRYSINDEKIRNLGWKNKRSFDNELPKIVSHYKDKFIW